MHYYQFNIGDYRKDTSFLSLLEHGIYRALIDTYYLNEGPLCDDLADLMRTHCVRTAEEQEAFNYVIEKFFEKTKKGYIHKKCEEIISQYAEKSEKARASAKARWNAKAMRTHSEGNANHKPKTNNHKPVTKDNNMSSDAQRLFEYWQVVMKKEKAKLTSKRKNCILARLREGYSVDQISMAIDGCMSSPYHMGQNDGGTLYNDLTLICRSGDKVESFIDRLNPVKPNGANHAKRKESLAEQRARETEEILADIDSGKFDHSPVGQNGAAFRPQMAFTGGAKENGERTIDAEFSIVVPEDRTP